MRVTYACPACPATASIDRVEDRDSLACPACHATLTIPADGLGGGAGQPRRLQRCLVCPSHELFVRKDFPQRVGLAIVVAGLAASCVAWANRELLITFGILFGTALLDVTLYFLMPDCLSCYRCGARYSGDGVADQLHGPQGDGRFGGFDLETHEKHRQLAARTRHLSSDPSQR
ncbi:MAG: hypothetical protein EBX36_00780 [Planctomycetia bacterium]|nr:hypothetical protein [Planctomycetia bacterium]